MLQLILFPKEDSMHREGFVWKVIETSEDQQPFEGLYGSNSDLTLAVEQGVLAFRRAICRPEGPVRHEWNCSCDATLVLEAHRSRKSPYSWDSPREITCTCGRVYGVKLKFTGSPGLPIIEPIYRTMNR